MLGSGRAGSEVGTNCELLVVAVALPSPLPAPHRRERPTGRAHGERHQSLVAGGGSRTGIAVQASPADCAYSIARRVCLDIDSISADGACRVAVPVLVRVYAFVADRTPRPAVAFIISADVFTANRASRIAVLISVGVYSAIAVGACRITRSIRVKAAALGVQWNLQVI